MGWQAMKRLHAALDEARDAATAIERQTDTGEREAAPDPSPPMSLLEVMRLLSPEGRLDLLRGLAQGYCITFRGCGCVEPEGERCQCENDD